VLATALSIANTYIAQGLMSNDNLKCTLQLSASVVSCAGVFSAGGGEDEVEK